MTLNIEKIQSRLYILLLTLIPLDTLFTFEVGSKAISPTKFFLMMLLLTSLLKLVARGFKFTLPPGFLKVLPFLFVILVLDVIATFKGIASFGLVEIVENLFYIYIVFVTLEICDRDIQVLFKGLKMMAIMLALGVVLIIVHVNCDLSLFSWIDVKNAKNVGSFLVPSFRTTIFPMTYGRNGILIFSVLSFCLFSIGRKGLFFKSRFSPLLVALLLVFAVLISNSRSTWLGLMVLLFSFLSYFVLGNKYLKRVFILYILVFLAFIIVNVDFVSSHYQDITPDIYSMRRRAVTTRLVQYKAAMEVIQEKPLLGLGHGTFKTTTDIHNVFIHNYFLRRGVDIGSIGGIFILLLFGSAAALFLKGISRNIGSEKGLILLCSLASFLGMITEMMLYDGSRGLAIVWIWIALAFSRFTSGEPTGMKSGNPKEK